VADPVRITIRVHPGAARARIGGWRAEPAHDRVLEVWVTQRAVDGSATRGALEAIAGLAGVRRRSVRLVAGARGRVKIVEILDPPGDIARRLGLA
jgi:uncharacterized protein YggU (UPF0235/DUF167 family)